MSDKDAPAALRALAGYRYGRGEISEVALRQAEELADSGDLVRIQDRIIVLENDFQHVVKISDEVSAAKADDADAPVEMSAAEVSAAELSDKDAPAALRALALWRHRRGEISELDLSRAN